MHVSSGSLLGSGGWTFSTGLMLEGGLRRSFSLRTRSRNDTRKHDRKSSFKNVDHISHPRRTPIRSGDFASFWVGCAREIAAVLKGCDFVSSVVLYNPERIEPSAIEEGGAFI